MTRWSSRVLRTGAACAAITLALTGTAVAATADPPPPGTGIPLTVDVTDLGALTLEVDVSTPVRLQEGGSTSAVRQFTAALPAVTVRDTRTSVEPLSGWAVTGIATDFASEGSAAVISADHLGWTPRLLQVPEDDDEVTAGLPVRPEVDGGQGLSGGWDLLVSAFDAEGAAAFGRAWTATADLALRVPVEKAIPGSYRSSVTLSLFPTD